MLDDRVLLAVLVICGEPGGFAIEKKPPAPKVEEDRPEASRERRERSYVIARRVKVDLGRCVIGGLFDFA
jgi:hypothetical protein